MFLSKWALIHRVKGNKAVYQCNNKLTEVIQSYNICI